MTERWRESGPGVEWYTHGARRSASATSASSSCAAARRSSNTAQTLEHEGKRYIFCSRALRVDLRSASPSATPRTRTSSSGILAGEAPANLLELVRSYFGLTQDIWGKDVHARPLPVARRAKGTEVTRDGACSFRSTASSQATRSGLLVLVQDHETVAELAARLVQRGGAARGAARRARACSTRASELDPSSTVAQAGLRALDRVDVDGASADEHAARRPRSTTLWDGEMRGYVVAGTQGAAASGSTAGVRATRTAARTSACRSARAGSTADVITCSAHHYQYDARTGAASIRARRACARSPSRSKTAEVAVDVEARPRLMRRAPRTAWGRCSRRARSRRC